MFTGKRLAAAAGILCAALLLSAAVCFALPEKSFPLYGIAAQAGDYVQLRAADAFQYIAFDGQDKWLMVRTPQDETVLVQVSNRFYDEHLAEMAFSHAGSPVPLAGRVTEAETDVIRFAADAANMSESAFSARIRGLCVDTTTPSPLKRAAAYLAGASAPFGAVCLLLFKKGRIQGISPPFFALFVDTNRFS